MPAPKIQSFDHDPSDDLLWRHVKSVPAFRALLRSVEARFYQSINLPRPILDLGCGDGHFASLTFDQALDIGIDPWWGPLRKARRSGAYGATIQSLGDQLPFPDDHFASVISNSVLEHIPNLEPVLVEVSRVLRIDGMLVITTPSHYFTEYLGGALTLEKLKLRGMASVYRSLFNRISRHYHTDTPGVWERRFADAGFEVEYWQYYFSKKALHTLEIGHFQGLPSALIHLFTGRWILAPWRVNLYLTERWIRPYYEEEYPDEGTMQLFIARKKKNIS